MQTAPPACFLTLYDDTVNDDGTPNPMPVSPNSGGASAAVVELDLLANPSGSAPTVGLQLGAGADAELEAVATPAPSSWILLGTALGCLAVYCLRKQRALWAMMG